MTLRTSNAGIGRLLKRFHVFAFRVVTTANEFSVTALFDDQIMLAFRAGSVEWCGSVFGSSLRVFLEIACVFALRVVGASDKAAAFA